MSDENRYNRKASVNEMNQDQPLAVIPGKIAELANALGVSPITGPWIHKLDDRWIVAVNGRGTVKSIKPDGCMEVSLKPYHFAVWYNGWIAGLMTPYDGVLAAGTGANEDALIKVLDEAIRAARADAEDTDQMLDAVIGGKPEPEPLAPPRAMPAPVIVEPVREKKGSKKDQDEGFEVDNGDVPF